MIAVPLHRFTVDDYHRMAEVGVLGEDERVELLNGNVVQMMPIGPFHGRSVKRLNHLFERMSAERWITSVQDPVRLSDHDEPQPDLALLRPDPDFYGSGHPGPADIFLIVEVSDSTLLLDREEKLPLYARAGIVEVWIVNLPERVVEVYREPSGGEYRQTVRVQPGEPLAPASFPDALIDSVSLLQAPGT